LNQFVFVPPTTATAAFNGREGTIHPAPPSSPLPPSVSYPPPSLRYAHTAFVLSAMVYGLPGCASSMRPEYIARLPVNEGSRPQRHGPVPSPLTSRTFSLLSSAAYSSPWSTGRSSRTPSDTASRQGHSRGTQEYVHSSLTAPSMPSASVLLVQSVPTVPRPPRAPGSGDASWL
jgi:hypothetical protein